MFEGKETSDAHWLPLHWLEIHSALVSFERMTGLINLKSVVKGKSWCVGMGTWWGTSTVHQVTRFLGEDDVHWTDRVGKCR